MTRDEGQDRLGPGTTAAAVALVVVVGAVGAVGAVGTVGAAGISGAPGQLAADEPGETGPTVGAGAVEAPETDNTVTRIEVQGNGDARWHVRVRTRLATDEDVTAYEAYQERLRDNRSAAVASFRERMKDVVAAAGNVTDRETAATNFTVSTTIRPAPQRWGITTTSFTWEGFARTEGERLHVGDAFQSGYFITEDGRLQLRAPEGYELAAVSPAPDEREDALATWFGRVDFGEGEPSATVAPAGSLSGGGDGGGDGSGDEGGDGGDDGGDGPGTPWIGLALLAGVVALGVASVWYRRRSAPATESAAADDRIAADGASLASSDGAQAADIASSGAAGPATPEPITDGERVRRLVSENGGRMKQADIVEQVDWSKSKVSRVLGDLADEGVVEKTRIGRENVVSLVEDGEDEEGGGVGKDPSPDGI